MADVEHICTGAYLCHEFDCPCRDKHAFNPEYCGVEECEEIGQAVECVPFDEMAKRQRDWSCVVHYLADMRAAPIHSVEIWDDGDVLFDDGVWTTVSELRRMLERAEAYIAARKERSNGRA